MIPDLGKYTFEVLASYGASILLIAALIGLSFRARARVKRRLAEVEARAGRPDA